MTETCNPDVTSPSAPPDDTSHASPPPPATESGSGAAGRGDDCRPKPSARAGGAWLLAGAMLAATALPAEARHPEDVPSAVDAPIGDSARHADGRSDWNVELGVLGVYWQVYEGSEDHEFVGFPLFRAEYRDRYFIDALDGIGVHLVNTDSYKLTTAITYTLGRDEDDSSDLEGLGDIDPGTAVSVAGEFTSGGISYGAKVVEEVSGDDTGHLADFEVGYTDIISDRSFLEYSVIASYASSEYMESYFGVTPTQANDSGLARFDADAGFKSAGLQLTGLRLLDNGWSLQGEFRYERLLGDAADSPVVREENRVTLAIGVAHSF